MCKQDGQFTCSVTLRRVRVTVVAVETQQCVVCIVELVVTANKVTILSVAQQRFYGEFNVAYNNKTYVFMYSV
jgi:hypothetical protein